MVKRATINVTAAGALLALVVGFAAEQLGVMVVAGALALGLAAAAFIDLRITLLAMIPIMVLLPELPLAVPIRTEDMLMAPLVAAWLGRLIVRRERWPSTPLNAPIVAVVAIELVALLWGTYRGTAALAPQLYSASFFTLKTVEVAFLYFIVVSAVKRPSDVRLFALALAASAAALGLWGVVEGWLQGTGEAITGPAGHGGYSLLGLTYVVLLAVVVGLILTVGSGALRIGLLLAALPVAFSLLFTFSRQSYVGGVAVMATLLWFRDRRLLVPALLVVLALPLAVPELVQERASSIVTGAADPVTGLSPYATRLHALGRRLPEVMEKSPFLGFGPAALPPGFLDNQYLLSLYYTGLVGLAAFLWLLWRALRTAYRAYRRMAGELRGLALAWLAATVGLALAGLAGSPFVAVRVRQVYWLLAALAVAAYGLTLGAGAETEVPAAAEEAR